MINQLMERILKNKEAKGFPIGDYEYDFEKLREEFREALVALESGDDDKFAEELCDMLILILGMASYKKLNMETSLLSKMDIIEKRKIIKLAYDKFTKEEDS